MGFWSGCGQISGCLLDSQAIHAGGGHNGKWSVNQPSADTIGTPPNQWAWSCQSDSTCLTKSGTGSSWIWVLEQCDGASRPNGICSKISGKWCCYSDAAAIDALHDHASSTVPTFIFPAGCTKSESHSTSSCTQDGDKCKDSNGKICCSVNSASHRIDGVTCPVSSGCGSDGFGTRDAEYHDSVQRYA